jgi:hypothetical protein
MSMPQTVPGPAPVFPEIERSDLEAARRFLTGGLGDDPPARPFRPSREVKAPTVHNGIARSRVRSASKTGN